MNSEIHKQNRHTHTYAMISARLTLAKQSQNAIVCVRPRYANSYILAELQWMQIVEKKKKQKTKPEKRTEKSRTRKNRKVHEERTARSSDSHASACDTLLLLLLFADVCVILIGMAVRHMCGGGTGRRGRRIIIVYLSRWLSNRVRARVCVCVCVHVGKQVWVSVLEELCLTKKNRIPFVRTKPFATYISAISGSLVFPSHLCKVDIRQQQP